MDGRKHLPRIWGKGITCFCLMLMVSFTLVGCGTSGSSLSEWQQPKTMEALFAALKAEDANARIAAAKELGKIGGREAIKPLEAVAQKDTSPLVREAAKAALEDIKARLK